jgi:type IV pilus assembly protein PilW
MKKNTYPLYISNHHGFSLVEIMVGMVIALLGVIIIFQVFSVSEQVKRTTTSGGDALQNGAAALFSLERSLKGAGYGFFPNGTLAADPAVPVPVAITVGGSPAVTTGGVTSCGAASAVTNSDCMVLMYRQNWDFGSFAPVSAVASSVAFSSPPPLTVETISVNSQGQLISNVNGVISEGVALFKVEYGTDANGNGVIDTNEWSQTAPANVLTVYAVRIALVARSAQPEKPSIVGGTCDTTTTYPTSTLSSIVDEFGNAARLSLSGKVGLAAGDDWKCYRYKTFETTVPLRNVIWRP